MPDVPLPHVYRVTKYDPADRAPDGTYRGTQDTNGDNGPVDAAYLAAVAAFAEESRIERFAVRDPQVGGGFGRLDPEGAIDRAGPLGPFADGFDGFYDGAPVTVPVALELVRMMNGDGGLWCRLEAEDAMTVEVGWDQYVYVGVRTPCEGAVARTHALGLFAEPIGASPYDPAQDEEYELRPADDVFWERVRASAARGEAGLIEENPAANASRWHLVGPLDDEVRLDAIRAALAPRARVYVWPPLSTDTAGLIAGLPEEFLLECVWEDADGRISSGHADDDDRTELARVLAGARAATLLPVFADDHDPLFTGVLPDADGVVRARWQL
ncbi:RNA-binding protein [Streptomyces sp. NPDC002886]|uniref:RNA-binding protein n=1 Tax=Streptomyces sp. NPDC002886 TaxID=3364667 RepID=UPI0036AED1A7